MKLKRRWQILNELVEQNEVPEMTSQEIGELLREGFIHQDEGMYYLTTLGEMEVEESLK